LLLRYGQALVRAEEAGADVLAEAARELLDAGDREHAAEADVLLGQLLMMTQGRREEAAARFDHAATLLAEASPSRAKARVLAGRAHFHLVTDEAEEAVMSGREALGMAEALGLDELRSNTLSTLGFARVMTGDLEGLRDLRESVELAERANSPEAARGYNNLASVTADLGDLARAFELYSESRRVAARFGDALALRWLGVELMYEEYWRGSWDRALSTGEALLAAGDDGSLHELDVLLVRAKIALVREGAAGALAEVGPALEQARSVAAPQILLPVLAFEAHALATAGRAGEAAEAAGELTRLWLEEGRAQSLASFWLADLAFALTALGSGGALAAAAGRARTRTRWLEAALAAAEGDWPRAAGIYARVGSRPDEALARLRAAEELAAADRPAEAEEERRLAGAFYRDVEAVAAGSG
ncbi:MAG TPA: hypothetical protein VD704_11065, partial [Gaiellaceae bacterium]|nr:hypothetical protein [Gaiellaceae bacterium]